jgi:Tfp pilus assembly protein FimV
MAVRCEELHGGRAVALPRRGPHAGRLGTLALTAAVVVAGTLSMAIPGGSPMASSAHAPKSIVMRSGQTLWEVAERYAPASVDVRAYVDALVEINDLAGGIVQPGERIRLPR